VEDDIDLNAHLIKNIPSTFLIRVQGKSMNKIGINDGDLLVVDRSLNPKNFSTVIANVNEELVVKSFIKEKDQSFLTSGSKKFKDKINLTENPEIFIWGVVTYVIHALQ
jgi:DNA polymerase V